MKAPDKWLLLVFGIIVWILGTLWYRMRGTILLETTSFLFRCNFVLVPIFSAAVCILLLKVHHVPASDWSVAMLLIALPGMFGEALLLSHFTTFMPHLRAESAGKYGALLFASYALALTIAEAVTFRSR
jgi:hypothetical protein